MTDKIFKPGYKLSAKKIKATLKLKKRIEDVKKKQSEILDIEGCHWKICRNEHLCENGCIHQIL